MLESTIRLKTVLNHRLEADKKLYKALRTLIKQYYKKNIPIDKACYELLIGSLKHLEEHSKMDKGFIEEAADTIDGLQRFDNTFAAINKNNEVKDEQ